MVQYKQCKNLQNGMKNSDHPYKLQVMEEKEMKKENIYKFLIVI